MHCVECGTELSAGDITLNGGSSWVVMCHNCDAVQPFKVEMSQKGAIVVIDGGNKCTDIDGD